MWEYQNITIIQDDRIIYIINKKLLIILILFVVLSSILYYMIYNIIRYNNIYKCNIIIIITILCYLGTIIVIDIDK